MLVPVAVGGSNMADAIDPSLEAADPQGGEDEATASLDPLPAPGAEAAHADEGEGKDEAYLTLLRTCQRTRTAHHVNAQKCSASSHVGASWAALLRPSLGKR